ncbi:MAG: hypothetical protein J6W74_04320 [Bacteroidales bacterium]|nr:hypothetical protein [Bacteroidales bacterium]
MKKLLLLFASALLLMSGTNVFAQSQADSCNIYRSYYTDYRKQGNYERAIPNWRIAYRLCEHSSSEALLLDGINFMRRLASAEKDQVKKMSIVDTLLTITDERLQYFPKSKVSVLNTKGTDVHNFYKDDEPAFQHKVYSEIIDAIGEQTSYNIFLYDFYTVVDLYKQEKIDAEVVVAKYTEYMDVLDRINTKSKEDLEKAKAELEVTTDAKKQKALEKNIENLEKAVAQIPVNRANIENGFVNSKVASCDQIIKIFTPKFEADPENVNLINTIVFLMNKAESCNNNDLYLKVASAKYQLSPSASSAYALYRLNAAKGNDDEAIRFLTEAIDFSESDEVKGDYYYELAMYHYSKGAKGKAYDAVRKAMDKNPSEYKGKAYMLMGTIWGGMNCGEGTVGRRAHYWVAVDYLIQARNADPSIADDANRLIGTYSAYFPKAEDVFFDNLAAGQSYTVSCGGMTATTTVRTK